MTSYSDIPEDVRSTLLACRQTALMAQAETGEVKPFSILVTPEAHYYVPAVSFNNAEDKEQYLHIVRATALVNDAQQVAFVSEAWFVRVDAPDAHKKYEEWRRANPDKTMEEYDGRSELIRIQVEAESGRASLMLVVKRSPGSNAPYVENIDDETYLTWAETDSDPWVEEVKVSRFAMMYLPRRFVPTPEILERAKNMAQDYLTDFELQKVMMTSDDLKPVPVPRKDVN